MVEWLAMMHVTPVVLSLNPTSVKLLFHNQKRSKKKAIPKKTELCPSMTEITILTLTNCELKIIRFEMFLRSIENQHFDTTADKNFTK